MKFKPNFAVTPQADNTIIGFYDGMAIIENEWGNLFYVVMPEELVSIGQIVQTDALNSIDNLSIDKQNEIVSYIKSLH